MILNLREVGRTSSKTQASDMDFDIYPLGSQRAGSAQVTTQGQEQMDMGRQACLSSLPPEVCEEDLDINWIPPPDWDIPRDSEMTPGRGQGSIPRLLELEPESGVLDDLSHCPSNV